jgi:hypothetical protein
MDALDRELAALEARVVSLEAQLEGRRLLLRALAAEKDEAHAATEFLRERLQTERERHAPLIDRHRLWAQKPARTSAP